MVEKAVDDLVWSGKFDSFSSTDALVSWMRGMPWYAQFSFDHKDIRDYSTRKCNEHYEIMQKLMRIQAFILERDVERNRDMGRSIDPLIAHHRWLRNSYNNVNISNTLSTTILR